MRLRMPEYDAKLVAAVEEHLDMAHLTEIVKVDDLDDPDEDFLIQFARGRRKHGRPMFQTFPLGHGSAYFEVARKKCSACYDLARTWNCPDHPEPRWDAVRHRWSHEHLEGRNDCRCDTCAPGYYRAGGFPFAPHVQTLQDRIRRITDGLPGGSLAVHLSGSWQGESQMEAARENVQGITGFTIHAERRDRET